MPREKMMCAVVPDTPLANYARLKSEEQLETSPMTFPMYTVAVEILLKMTELKPHEELLSKGELTIFEPRLGKAGFISHQWASRRHPDPECKQMRVLQDSLRNLMSGRSEVSVDMITEAVTNRSEAMPSSSWQSGRLFLWYDYFSCPQHVSWLGGQGHTQQQAIDSIPAYVSRCNFFMALCPVLSNLAEEKVLSEYTWAQRGWCRVEQTVWELSKSEDWILVKSATHQELKVNAMLQVSPGEGRFTVEEDRDRIATVMLKFLKTRLLTCLKDGDLPQYRMMLNQQTSFLRHLPVEPIEDVVPGFQGDDVLEKFMYQNGFRKLNEVDEAGWSPMCYACMRGEPALIAALLAKGALPTEVTRKSRNSINLSKGSPLLSICARFKHIPAMRLLIDAKAEVNTSGIIHPPLHVAAQTNDVRGVQLLCAAGADPNLRNVFGDCALGFAAAGSAVDTMDALLERPGGKQLSLSLVLHVAVMLQGGCREVVERLVKAGADIDEPYGYQSSILKYLHKAKALQHRLGKKTMLRRVAFHLKGSTPLMVSILCANFEAAASLIIEGARLDSRNARGKTAYDLAKEFLAPDFVLEAMEGRLAKCCSLVSASISMHSNCDDTFSI